MPPYRILSLDGGGIRGVFTATLLERLEREAGINFFDKVDLFSGTSTGGILALGLAAGLKPSECKKLYVDHGQEIFSRAPLSRFSSVVFAKYSNRSLQQRLQDIFYARGMETLGDLPKKVLIPSFDLWARPDDRTGSGVNSRYGVDTWKPKFFDNFEGPGSDSDRPIVEVALSTSAAPTLFPSWEKYIDGGVMANNPSMCAVAQALKDGVELKDISLLSVGTGLNPKFLETGNLNWGWLRWIRFDALIPSLSAATQAVSNLRGTPVSSATLITELLVEGTLDVANYQARQILKANYHRLNPLLEQGGRIVQIDFDHADKIPQLLDIAEKAELKDDTQGSCVSTVEWLRQYFS
jgi:uncharacterized protein